MVARCVAGLWLAHRGRATGVWLLRCWCAGGARAVGWSERARCVRAAGGGGGACVGVHMTVASGASTVVRHDGAAPQVVRQGRLMGRGLRSGQRSARSGMGGEADAMRAWREALVLVQVQIWVAMVVLVLSSSAILALNAVLAER